LAALDMGSTNVIDLMAALQSSIAEDDKAKPGPAPQPEKSKLTKAVAPKRGR
jgi:non-homologous end joining protein Ku